jgi:hypothetical protein
MSEKMVCVQMAKRWGSLFPGEQGSYPEQVANELVATKIAHRVLEDGSLEPWPEEPEPEAIVPTSGQPSEGDKIGQLNMALELFTADGLDEKTAKALVDIGLNSPDKVRQHIAEGKTFDSLNKTQTKSVLALYAE